MHRLRRFILGAAVAGVASVLTASTGFAATSVTEAVSGIETGAGSIGVFVTPGGLLPCGSGHSCFSGVAQGQMPGLWSTDVLVAVNPQTGLPAHVGGGIFYLTTSSGNFTGTVDPANVTPGSVEALGWGLCEQSFAIHSAFSLPAPSVPISSATLKHFGFLNGARCNPIAASISGSVTLSI